jgi:diguanylate cyclase (GGDEF)-like protein
MAATDPRPIRTYPAPSGPGASSSQWRATEHARTLPMRCLDAPELYERVEEEIGRASRHGTALCCLLLRLENFQEISKSHGEDLSERALMHAGETLLSELRRFDRIGRPLEEELVVVLPGAASFQGEAVARRALRRMRAIKIEVDLVRRPLCVSIGIAAWRTPWSAQELIDEARSAAGVARAGTRD